MDQDDRRRPDPYGLGRWRQQVEAQVREHAAKCGARNCTGSGNLQIDDDRLEARLLAERHFVLDVVTVAITELLAQERRYVMRGLEQEMRELKVEVAKLIAQRRAADGRATNSPLLREFGELN